MSHPDPLFDFDNSHEEDDMSIEHDSSDALLAEYLYDDHNDFYGDDEDFEDNDYDESMDGDHDSAMDSIGWGDDDSLAYGGGDYYGEDF